tara:strand:- start:3812 stop:4180 length:369 start_codon:yes stop_codon:yes gene_type:complete
MPQKDPTAEHRPLEHCLGPITRSRAIGVKEAPYRHRPPELALISKPLHSLDRVVVALNAVVGELGGVVQGVTREGVSHECVWISFSFPLLGEAPNNAVYDRKGNHMASLVQLPMDLDVRKTV